MARFHGLASCGHWPWNSGNLLRHTIIAWLAIGHPVLCQEMVCDINRGAGSVHSATFDFNLVGQQLVCGASTLNHGSELWVTDGTEAGTRMLADANPGPGDGIDYRFRLMGYKTIAELEGWGYFTSNSNSGNQAQEYQRFELWRTDGSPDGTEPLFELQGRRTFLGATKKRLIMGTEELLGGWYGEPTVYRLWGSDGRREGTELILERDFDFRISELMLIREEGFFLLSERDAEGVVKNSIWKTDGTARGTGNVLTQVYGFPLWNIEPFTWGNMFCFAGGIVQSGRMVFGVWGLDSETMNLSLIDSIGWRDVSGNARTQTWTDPTDVLYYTVFIERSNGSRYFSFRRKKDENGGIEILFETENTNPGIMSSEVRAIGGKIYFAGPGLTTSMAWFEFDSETDNLKYADYQPFDRGLNVTGKLNMIQGSQSIFILGGYRCWLFTEERGMEEMPELILFNQPNPFEPGLNLPVFYREEFYVPRFNSNRIELNALDPVAGKLRVVRVLDHGAHSYQQVDTEFKMSTNLLYLASSYGYLKEVRSYNGHEQDCPVLYPGDVFNDCALFKNDLVCTAEETIYQFDGLSGQASVFLKRGSTSFSMLQPAGDQYAFVFGGGEYLGNRINALYKIGVGAPELVHDFGPDLNYWQYPQRGLIHAGHLYFSLARNGGELWTSDGSTTGTYCFHQGFPLDLSVPTEMTATGAGVFFVPGITDRELWVIDGIPPAIRNVRDIHPGQWSSNPATMRAAGNLLYFIADDGEHGRELWRSDGTRSGTYMVVDLLPGRGDGARDGHMVWWNGYLYFTGRDGDTGFELWRSDGTPNGTSLVREICPGRRGSCPESFCAIGQRLYFRALEPGTGMELWETDGTTEGTRLIADLNPGPVGSVPGGLKHFLGQLVFTADDGRNGRELWRYVPDPGTVAREGSLLIFPNPNSGWATIFYANPNEVVFTQLTDSMGRVLVRFDGFRATLNFDHLPRGIYMLSLATRDRNISARVVYRF